jgi:hypothetical protein
MPPLVRVAPRQVQHEVEYDDPEPSFPVAFALLGISLVALLLYFLWEGQASAAKPMGQTSQDSSTFPICVQSSVPFKDIRSRYAYTCYTYEYI